MKSIYSILFILVCFASAKAQQHLPIYKAWIFVQYDSAGQVIKPLQDQTGHVKFNLSAQGFYTYSIRNKYNGTISIEGDSIQWGNPLGTLVGHFGETAYWEWFFNAKIWRIEGRKTAYKVSRDSLYINNADGRQWIFIDSAVFDFNKLIPDKVASIESDLNTDFNIPDHIRQYIFRDEKRKRIDTIPLKVNDHHYSASRYFRSNIRLINIDTLIYSEERHLRFHLPEGLSLNIYLLDSTVRFSYFARGGGGRNYSDAGLSFKHKNGAYYGIRIYADSFYTDADKLPQVKTLKSMRVNGTKYINVSIFEAGTMRRFFEDSYSFMVENPIVRIYWASEIGPVQIEYKDGTKKHLLKYY